MDSRVEAERLDRLRHAAERFVDRQSRATEELDDKVELILGISIGLLGAGVAAAGPTLQAATDAGVMVAASGTWILVLGFVLNVAATLLLLHGYVGLGQERAPALHAGPQLQ